MAHFLCLLSPTPPSQDQSPGNHGNAGQDPVTFRCELDPKLTEKDLPFFIPDIQGTWGSACGRNRGVFVVDPPDGHTYGNLSKSGVVPGRPIGRSSSTGVAFDGITRGCRYFPASQSVFWSHA